MNIFLFVHSFVNSMLTRFESIISMIIISNILIGFHQMRYQIKSIVEYLKMV